LRQRGPVADALQPKQPERDADESPVRRSAQQGTIDTAAGPRKLSYQERRELDALPARIEALEAEQRALGLRIADPDFYKEAAAAITGALERVQQVERELVDLYARWDALDSRNDRS